MTLCAGKKFGLFCCAGEVLGHCRKAAVNNSSWGAQRATLVARQAAAANPEVLRKYCLRLVASRCSDQLGLGSRKAKAAHCAIKAHCAIVARGVQFTH